MHDRNQYTNRMWKRDVAAREFTELFIKTFSNFIVIDCKIRPTFNSNQKETFQIFFAVNV
jgi:hypothetical protein